MPRPHVEFIKSREMRWLAVPGTSPRYGCEMILLSEDVVSGACSLLLRYPPGWTCGHVERLHADEEVFILSGELRVAGTRLVLGDYAYWPAGFGRHEMLTRSGCTALTFFERAPRASTRDCYDQNELIVRLSTADMPWRAPSDESLDAGRVTRKVLKETALDGGRTWLLKIDADSDPFEINGVERHPCVEEMFLLEGDMAMTCGTMRPGDYFWRPPMIAHGPMGTRNGFLGFFRAKEGSFATEWSPAAEPIAWDAPYRPILPRQSALPR